MKMGTASLIKASGKACWRRWRFQMGLDEESSISLGNYIHPCWPFILTPIRSFFNHRALPPTQYPGHCLFSMTPASSTMASWLCTWGM